MRVLVLGGYGFFGERIATTLARTSGIQVLVAGRSLEKARQLVQALGLSNDRAAHLDTGSTGFTTDLQRLNVDVLIHTAGPFQGQDYAVARAAIAAGCHYIDLADGRAFVTGISQLDTAAKERGVAVISGASSVPGLSSAVVDRYLPDFGRLESIRMGIGTGARAPGIATVRGIFGYCGKPIRRLENGAWTTTHGWLDTQHHRFPEPVGARLLGSCDVPDLDLFPHRYPSAKTVTFHAGFASDLGHRVVWTLAGMVKAGVLSSVTPFAPALNRASQWIEPWVSDKGAMFVELRGADRDARPLTREWNLVVTTNHGPFIPCGASIALALKFAVRAGPRPGAYPCLGLVTVDEYLEPLKGLNFSVTPP